MDATGNLSVTQMTTNIGALVEGVDLRRPLSADTAAFLRQAILDHGVIFMRDQDITLEQYWHFMENFGQPHKEESTGTDDDRPDDVQTGNLVYTRHATAVWHADTTSLAKPPIATALRAVEVPPFGGDTCWSSMYAAWEALSGPMKRMLDGLTAVHSIQCTVDRMQEYGAAFEQSYGQRNAPEQVHPVVLTHPETGRKALYVSECFTTRIVELEPAESAAVLSMLFRHVERPDFTVRWKWSPNDMAFWDNRSVQHYAVPDYDSTRCMQRIVLAGVKPGTPSALVPAARELASADS
ncbi:MAG: TauD/TfdA family dioxygenase [Novosphingobium sp.]|nr:TauD/TfdA family dioxygenase [Novosphingobium sp.]MCP5401153.1 TauD/TfdA family dioxygenase [Novosphingobium sp.]